MPNHQIDALQRIENCKAHTHRTKVPLLASTFIFQKKIKSFIFYSFWIEIRILYREWYFHYWKMILISFIKIIFVSETCWFASTEKHIALIVNRPKNRNALEIIYCKESRFVQRKLKAAAQTIDWFEIDCDCFHFMLNHSIDFREYLATYYTFIKSMSLAMNNGIVYA